MNRMRWGIASFIIGVACMNLSVAQDETESNKATYELQGQAEKQGLTVYKIKRQNVTSSIEVHRGEGKLTDYYNTSDVEENVFQDGELGASTTLRIWRLN